MAGNKKRNEYEPIRDRTAPPSRYASQNQSRSSTESAIPIQIPPYDIEAGKFAILERQKHVWSTLDSRARKIQLLAILQAFIGILVSMDSVWYTHIFGIAIGLVGLVAVRGDKPDVLMVYLFLCIIEFVKNIGYVQDVWSHWGDAPPAPSATRAAPNGTDSVREYDPTGYGKNVNRWVAVGLENKYLIFQLFMVGIEEILLIPCVLVLGYASVHAALQHF
ncbi:hypothetical protein H310_11548 [Aphanomyces invadans]|uniref:Uncharacterized protein n=1 Tax=Aphanomyces invadans TaxID=157072 RepID=A0A024TLA4_9STRA|nr:hypothetical protein H310_11548 [Aphanomyces invadans]ETV94895.1 hypothetical protein H310_11548 [Aphanomyces invadans]|eukprot:XP_008876486.1 hypothetical protein H310_11548 [Aphanomyces invadans]